MTSPPLQAIHISLIQRPAEVLSEPSEGLLKVVRKSDDDLSSNYLLGSIDVLICERFHRLIRKVSHQAVVVFKGSFTLPRFDPVEEAHVLGDCFCRLKVHILGQLPSEGVAKDGKHSSSMRGVEDFGRIVKIVREKHSGLAIADRTETSAPLARVGIKGNVSDQMAFTFENVGTLLFEKKCC
jgi:hypothetical protein